MSTVCRFIPVAETMDAIQIINFVHEQERIHVEIKINPVCKICYVTGGTASLGFEGKTCTVRKGDVFFLLPAFDYSLHGAENFTYMYISFLGVGATAQMELMNISRKNFLFPDMADLEPFRLAAFSLKSEVIGIASQSVLLFTLAKIGDKAMRVQLNTDPSHAQENVNLIKKYVDEHYCSADLSVDQIARQFSYNKKYISTLFKSFYKMSLIQYINTMRINHACHLLEERTQTVSSLAAECGFRDPLYFSKVFKRKVGCAPSAYVDYLQKD